MRQRGNERCGDMKFVCQLASTIFFLKSTVWLNIDFVQFIATYTVCATNLIESICLVKNKICNSHLKLSECFSHFFFFHLVIKTLLPHFNSLVPTAQLFPLLKCNFPHFPMKVIIKKTKQTSTNYS